MKKHFAVVFVLVISSKFLLAETSRPSRQRPAYSQSEFSVSAETKDLAKRAAQLITTEALILGDKEAIVRPESVFEGIVVVSVELDYKGNVLNVDIVRGARFDPSYDKRAVAMVRRVKTFNVPSSFAGGKFMLTFFFEKGGRFKMKTMHENGG